MNEPEFHRHTRESSTQTNTNDSLQQDNHDTQFFRRINIICMHSIHDIHAEPDDLYGFAGSPISDFEPFDPDVYLR
jgi:hypothetical protein